jgi:hypothetical protein
VCRLKVSEQHRLTVSLIGRQPGNQECKQQHKI